MTEYWTCVNCNAIVTLDKHGRCSVCGSDAVVRRSLEHLALIAKLWPEWEDEIEEQSGVAALERLWNA